MDLFESLEGSAQEKSPEAAPPSAGSPLAYRMSPRTLAEYVGQEHIVGEGMLLRRAVEADRLSSVIFYGPPGTGKTALARVIARSTRSAFKWLNAALIGLDELRAVLKEARSARKRGIKTILFLDEIHRFNKLQQDALLPDVEEGNLVLIAATVENPFFYVNSALLSRSQVFELRPLPSEALVKLLERAISDKERGLGGMKIKAEPEALLHLARMSDGDGRKALSALEIAALTTKPSEDGTVYIDLSVAEASIQKKAVVYDKKGDQHYDTISAFIKSMRGGDPDAVVYYMAKMLYAGEDPRFIARRIVICAAEDVGDADPMALVLAVSALRAVEFVGMPEARIPLSEAAIYIAMAPKSNSCYVAIDAAMADVAEEETMPVPDSLRSTAYKGARELGHGVGYIYTHDHSEAEQEFLAKKKRYYDPAKRKAAPPKAEG